MNAAEASELRAEPGRTMALRDGSLFEIPATLVIPTCMGCGEQFFDQLVTDELDRAMHAAASDEL